MRLVLLHGSRRVSELAHDLAVSPITIRRDLATLEHDGLITRVHGGALRNDIAQSAGLSSEHAAKNTGPQPRV